MMTNYYLLIIVYKSSMKVEFIIIDKQEDLPTEAAMKALKSYGYKWLKDPKNGKK